MDFVFVDGTREREQLLMEKMAWRDEPVDYETVRSVVRPWQPYSRFVNAGSLHGPYADSAPSSKKFLRDLPTEPLVMP